MSTFSRRIAASRVVGVTALSCVALATALGVGASPAFAATSYKNGTYSTTGSYSSPRGTESIHVKITLSKNKITKVTVTPGVIDPSEKSYEESFASQISSVVVGKKIAGLSVSRVGGASLTSHGFNSALSKIRAKAKK